MLLPEHDAIYDSINSRPYNLKHGGNYMYHLIQRLKISVLCQQRVSFVTVASVSEKKQRPVFVMDMQCCLHGGYRQVSADAGRLSDRAVVVGDSIRDTVFHGIIYAILIILEITSNQHS